MDSRISPTERRGAIIGRLHESPRGVAFDSAGNLWVADTGNHRVLRFGAASLNTPAPVAADTVIGQKDFFSGTANAGGQRLGIGFRHAVGLTFDAQGNLYVADFRNARVLRFPAPLGPAARQSGGHARFGARAISRREAVPQQATAASIAGPQGIAVDGNGNLYVTDAGRQPRAGISDSARRWARAPRACIGQSDFTTTTANTGALRWLRPIRSPARRM